MEETRPTTGIVPQQNMLDHIHSTADCFCIIEAIDANGEALYKSWFPRHHPVLGAVEGWKQATQRTSSLSLYVIWVTYSHLICFSNNIRLICLSNNIHVWCWCLSCLSIKITTQICHVWCHCELDLWTTTKIRITASTAATSKSQ